MDEKRQTVAGLFEAIKADADHPFHRIAKKFEQQTRELFESPAGREWFYMLFRLAPPAEHEPITDPVLAAHIHGRAEMTAFLSLCAAPLDDKFPLPPTQHTHGKPNT